MEKWKQYRLIEVLDALIDYRGKTPKKTASGVPLITAKIIKNGRIETPTEFISVDDYDSWMVRGFPKIGDVVLTTEAPLGEVAQLDDAKIALAQRVVTLRGKSGILDNTYLKYYFLSKVGQQRLKARETGTTVTGIKQSELREVIVDVPPYDVQIRIAEVLQSLDSKIEVNRRINNNLEQQAQSLYKSWFVDFQPFRDKPFVDSEIGMIPVSLITKYISDISHTLETGRRPKGGVGEIYSGVPSVGAEHIKGLGNYDYSKTKYISNEYASSLKTGKVKGYELLIYKDGGKPGYFMPNYTIFGEGYPFDECYLNEHVFKLDFNDKGYNIFCYFYFKNEYVMNYLNAQGGKAAIPGINRKDIENIQIFHPDNEYVRRFGEFAEPLFKRILINCKASRRLAILRDTLLPRLMSGELEVKDIEDSL